MANRSLSSVSVAVLTLTSSFVSPMAFMAPSPPAGRIMWRGRTWLCHQTLRHCLISSAYARWRNSSNNSVGAKDSRMPRRAPPTDRGMLPTGISAHLHPDSGGVPMSDQSAPSERCVSPAQVWPALAPECKTRVVWLLAQLAFNLVIAQGECTTQEVSHATLSARQP
jgi:hypothetical protein